MILKRLLKVYLIIGKNFNSWLTPIFTGLMILVLRLVVDLFRILDTIVYPSLKKQIKNPIIIVGNPRSGTTFLHRYLISQGLGQGSQLWQMVYPSILLQKMIKPFLPYMEKISPAKHHSTDAHKTSLTSIETDDVSILFRFFDGFFLYGFFLTFNENNLFDWVDPKIRDTSKRDFLWFESLWKRNLLSNKGSRYLGKLFSLSSNLPEFQKKFPDSKIIYMIRDPLQVIPSGLSLVTGVLDKKFNFWSLGIAIQRRFIKRLYKALVELMNRFHEDWTNGKIKKEKVLIVKFDFMMSDFENLMESILVFLEIEKNSDLAQSIKATAKDQRAFKSKHQYDLNRFGLTEKEIKSDCEKIYRTFLS